MDNLPRFEFTHDGVKYYSIMDLSIGGVPCRRCVLNSDIHSCTVHPAYRAKYRICPNCVVEWSHSHRFYFVNADKPCGVMPKRRSVSYAT